MPDTHSRFLQRWAAALALGMCALSCAALSPPPLPPKPIAPPRPEVPTLQIAHPAESPVTLQILKVDTEIQGSQALTTVDMTFRNPNHRVLEGELQFPLLDGQQITSMALDFNGALREAVPVEKAKGQQVFEDVIRQRIDPALLEVTQGNNYKLRVYPLPANGTRRVVIRYSERLAVRNGQLAYRLPLSYAQKLPTFTASVRVFGDELPTATAGSLGSLRFQRSGGVYEAQLQRNDYAGKDVLELAVPAPTLSAVSTQVWEGKRYFLAEIPVPKLPAKAVRELPKRVGLVWDSSGSMGQQDPAKVFAVLDRYFQALGDGEVQLVRLRDAAEAPVRYPIRQGDWSELRKALEATRYDGGTQLAALPELPGIAELLLVSDGLSNFGERRLPSPKVPAYALSPNASADLNALRLIAHRSGGRAIDVATQSAADAAAALLQPAPRLSLGGDGVSQLLTEAPYPLHGRYLVAGQVATDGGVLRAEIGSGSHRKRIEIALPATLASGKFAAQAWAGLKLKELEAEYELNRGEIRRVGQHFRIPGRETSLIVLDRIEDYARYEIEPPAELKAEYDRLRAAGVASKQRDQQQQLARVLSRFEEKQRWWEREFPKERQKEKVLEIAKAERGPRPAGVMADRMDSAPQAASARQQAAPPRMMVESAAPAEAKGAAAPQPARPMALPEPVMSAPAAPVPSAPPPPAAKPALAAEPRPMVDKTERVEVTGRVAKRAAAGDARDVEERSRNGMTTAPAQAAIALKRWTPNEPYTQRLRNAGNDEVYRVYLDERPSYANSTAFFLDVADLLFERKLDTLAIRVLSNLAEMNLENRAILRILAYRLLQAKQPKLAIPVLQRVQELAPNEPQSWRDLGLAYAADGQAQKAIDALYEVVTRPWHDRFPDVEQVALGELNAILATSPAKLDVSRIDPRLLRNLPVDLRVVLTWDADNTDIDLWITDPDGDKGYYGNPLTYQGGRMSRDFTGGYGPEEFVLKQAKPGKYKVEANFFGHRQQVVAGATTLQVKLITGFGTARQEEKIVTMRLKGQSEVVYVGEFEIGR